MGIFDLERTAPGTVAVAVAALALGVLVTLLCFRLRKRNGDNKPKQ